MPFELKDFVKSVLSNIVAGIREAQEVDGVGAFIVPAGITGHDYAKHPRVSISSMISSTIVDFDIAVTAEDSKSLGGKGGIRIASFGASAEGAAESKDTHVSRIQFAVPILLPESKTGWYAELQKAKT